MYYNQTVGKFGEDLAMKYLSRNGYKIIGRNIKTSYKELDIIAEKDEEMVFVEVKTRTSERYGQAEDALENRKFGNLKKAVQYYLFKNKLFYNEVRVDFIAVDIDKQNKSAKIKHYQGIV